MKLLKRPKGKTIGAMASKLLLIVLVVLLNACLPNKNLVYLRNNNFSSSTPTAIANKPRHYTLKVADIINVRIKTLDTESSSYFNMLAEQSIFNLNLPGLYLNSHSINTDGMIEMPGVGKIKVVGLTLEEGQVKIQEALNDYLKNATVFVKLVSFKVSVLGEVRSPGYYYFYTEGANLMEALALAGDLTEYGNRENITLIRQTENGSESILVNLKNADILASPYYYLQPNDIIYIQPLRVKQTRSNLNTLSVLGILFSGVTAMVLILDYVNPR